MPKQTQTQTQAPAPAVADRLAYLAGTAVAAPSDMWAVSTHAYARADARNEATLEQRLDALDAYYA